MEVARILIQAGANPCDASVDRKTPLHYAVVNKHQQVVSLLLSDPRIDSNMRKEARELAVQKGDKAIIQMFDPEKREILSVIQDQQKVLDDLKEKIKMYEARRDEDQRLLDIAFKKLSEEEESHRQTKQRIQQLREQSRTRTVTDHEQRYIQLKSDLLQIQKKNAELQLQREEIFFKRSSDQRKVDVKVSDLHRNLSSLLSILDTTSMAIVSAKNSIEGSRQFLQIPKEGKKFET